LIHDLQQHSQAILLTPHNTSAIFQRYAKIIIEQGVKALHGYLHSGFRSLMLLFTLFHFYTALKVLSVCLHIICQLSGAAWQRQGDGQGQETKEKSQLA
jgi:hypothetical protein